MEQVREKRYEVLDGLRGVAAISVMLMHYSENTVNPLFKNADIAVDLFFILSGFVLAHAYGARLAGGWSPWLFMRARIIRLYPLYLLGSLIGLAAMLVGAVAGGFAGAHLARRLPAWLLRSALLATAVITTVLYFLRG